MSTKKPIRDLFGIDIDRSFTVNVNDIDESVEPSAYPSVMKEYIFDRTIFRKMLAFLTKTPVRNNILLTGDTGTGKTSLVEQMAGRLNIPVFELSCSGKMRLNHFVGGYRLKDGNTFWMDGPLVKAMKTGGIFLANEITRLDRTEQMSLAHILDNGVLTIPETGEIVKATKRFRFIATGNSAGQGDTSGVYGGETVSSSAFFNRFQKYRVDYLTVDQETELLSQLVPGLADTRTQDKPMTRLMAELARHVRDNFVSRGGDLRTVISTRDLCVWALETVRYKNLHVSDEPCYEALRDTVLNGASPEDDETITKLWNEWMTE